MTTVAVSGGFDPVHVGHIRLLEDASRYGRLIVFLNSDEWLIRKKDRFFMPWGERAEILLSMRFVDNVVRVDDSDGTVCEAIKRYRPHFFANGGDRNAKNTPEIELCNQIGVKTLFGIGGGKIRSSSDLLERYVDRKDVGILSNLG
jgi:D-beta-D-heptose 7-phosphate kinase/D-beta-D-heptose 1-phosphate adenosyltransferase